MPEIDPLLAQFPTQKDDFAVNLARKIKKPDVQILDLYTDRIDLGNCILNLLQLTVALLLSALDGRNVDQRAPVQKNPMSDPLELFLELLNALLSFDRFLDQRFQHRQQSVSLIQCESSIHL